MACLPTFSSRLLLLLLSLLDYCTGFHRRRDNANGLFVTTLYCSGPPLDLARFLTTGKPFFPLLCILVGNRGWTALLFWTIDIWYLRTLRKIARGMQQ